MAQRITRLTTDQKIAGSNPAVLESYFSIETNFTVNDLRHQIFLFFMMISKTRGRHKLNDVQWFKILARLFQCCYYLLCDFYCIINIRFRGISSGLLRLHDIYAFLMKLCANSAILFRSLSRFVNWFLERYL